jgi:hypothetical protein
MSKNNKNHKRIRQRKVINPFPCKDCITRPLCVNKYALKDEDPPYQTFYTTHGLLKELTQHCQLLKQYLYETDEMTPLSYLKLGKSLEKIIQREKVVYNFFCATKNRDDTLK